MNEPGKVSFAALGTTAVVLTEDPRAVSVARRAVTREIDAMDRAASRFRDDSDLSRVNDAAGRAVGVGALFLRALDVALDAAELTGGDVDPTVGAALAALGYDRDFTLVIDSGAIVCAPRPAGRWQDIEIDHRASTVRVPIGIRLDLGATAKALCADRAAAAAAVCAGCGVLVSLGGDVAVGGAGPPEGWAVLVTEDHHTSTDGPGQTVCLRDGGLATSSTTVRHWTSGSQHLHHVVDPVTGRPAPIAWRTVSVAAATCVAANIASTASIVRGEHAARSAARLGPAGPPGAPRRDRHHARELANRAPPMTAALFDAGGKELWYLTRGSGLVSQLLATAALLLGILTTFEAAPGRLARFVVPQLHRNVSLLVVAFVGLHVATTVVDGYAPIGWLDAVVPFRSAYKPAWVGLGAVAVDLFLAVVVTSVVRRHLGRRVWRATHWLSYAMWPIAMVHGYVIGSDRAAGWLRGIDIACISLVGGAILWRIVAPPRGGARPGEAPIGAAAPSVPRSARHRRALTGSGVGTAP